mmetsp:Transcript_79884/g.145785  ORF Transcript_79884/g.145785 Transcript_79884/m.145785 type:complete len:210 (-) Transcript_79884:372-1001(-)
MLLFRASRLPFCRLIHDALLFHVALLIHCCLILFSPCLCGIISRLFFRLQILEVLIGLHRLQHSLPLLGVRLQDWYEAISAYHCQEAVRRRSNGDQPRRGNEQGNFTKIHVLLNLSDDQIRRTENIKPSLNNKIHLVAQITIANDDIAWAVGDLNHDLHQTSEKASRCALEERSLREKLFEKMSLQLDEQIDTQTLHQEGVGVHVVMDR